MADSTGSNFITKLFDQFANAKVKSNKGDTQHSFMEHLNEQIAELGTGDSSDPQKLARYQKAMMMFSVHTNAQASVIKGINDIDKGIIRDFN
ncbi:EscF/YscF/HrpA family type III secretion system needle major subunit [Pandoraea fibrosis]|uniref:EscF/YscF/HrpA family type III secretion system needle major subunit n=1 Tax=Pandoraea fibrosis TaxID=1891094 RepID=A0ABX6HVP8_9BURK|nr:type III secretion system needle filament subunit SctF [Pandoraea fibrosis]QHE91854.1 EscF/YscF/HrpA family type III secretion system needle major subunit [Pandoraea fibrosis]QHF14589.1 EscF/YscF/HrpA family type III secretion system needle major subunit [Pandoraea fibrosis]